MHEAAKRDRLLTSGFWKTSFLHKHTPLRTIARITVEAFVYRGIKTPESCSKTGNKEITHFITHTFVNYIPTIVVTRSVLLQNNSLTFLKPEKGLFCIFLLLIRPLKGWETQNQKLKKAKKLYRFEGN